MVYDPVVEKETATLLYRFKESRLLKKQILQVGVLVSLVNVTTSKEISKPVLNWRDANRYEAETFLKTRGN